MTIEEAVIKLKEDYILRSILRKKNLNVQDELEDEIEDLEQSVITSKVIPELEKYAKHLLEDLECEVCLGVLKDANGDVRVENEYVDSLPVPFHEDTFETIGVTRDELIYDDTEEFVRKEPDCSESPILITRYNIQDADSHDLRITIDGRVYQEKNAIQTFIRVLQHIGLENVAKVGIMCSGYNLVDIRRRTEKNRGWQQQVDGKWVYVYFSNPTKCKYLLQIAEHLHKEIKIEAV